MATNKVETQEMKPVDPAVFDENESPTSSGWPLVPLAGSPVDEWDLLGPECYFEPVEYSDDQLFADFLSRQPEFVVVYYQSFIMKTSTDQTFDVDRLKAEYQAVLESWNSFVMLFKYDLPENQELAEFFSTLYSAQFLWDLVNTSALVDFPEPVGTNDLSQLFDSNDIPVLKGHLQDLSRSLRYLYLVGVTDVIPDFPIKFTSSPSRPELITRQKNLHTIEFTPQEKEDLFSSRTDVQLVVFDDDTNYEDDELADDAYTQVAESLNRQLLILLDQNKIDVVQRVKFLGKKFWVAALGQNCDSFVASLSFPDTFTNEDKEKCTFAFQAVHLALTQVVLRGISVSAPIDYP